MCQTEMIVVTPTWHTQPWCLQLLEMLIAKALLLPKKECCQRFFSRRASITNQQYHEISGVGNFGKSLALSGISERASRFIAEARQESSWY